MRAQSHDGTNLPPEPEIKPDQEDCPRFTQGKGETRLLSSAAIEKSAADFDRAAARWISVGVNAAMANRKTIRGRLRPEPEESYFSLMLSGKKPSPLRTLWALRGERDSIRAVLQAMADDLAPSLEVRDRRIPTREEAHRDLVHDMARGDRGRKSVIAYTAQRHGITEAEAEELLFGSAL